MDIPIRAGDLAHRDVGLVFVYADGKTSVRAPITSILHQEREVTVYLKIGDQQDDLRFDFNPDAKVQVEERKPGIE